MGKKYIIELLDECNSEFKGIMVFGLTQEKQISVELIPEESLRPYTEPEAHAEVTADAYQRGYETAKHECEDCPKQAYTDALKMESYQKGLNDAWETVKELFGFTFDEKATIFKTTSVRDIVRKYSASEAIEKLKAYKQGQEEQIQVGDEVELKCGVSPAIYMQGTNGSDEIYLLFNDGSCGIHGRDEIECKTGRHFPEIAEVLAKMKESE